MQKRLESCQGQCLCDAVQYTISGDIHGFFLCHCTRCQKSSGSAHASNAFIKNATLVWEAGEDNIVQYQVPETRFSKQFCSTCGAPLPILAGNDGTVCVPAGSLNDFEDFAPTAHIFVKNKKAWEERLIEAPKFEGLPHE